MALAEMEFGSVFPSGFESLSKKKGSSETTVFALKGNSVISLLVFSGPNINCFETSDLGLASLLLLLDYALPPLAFDWGRLLLLREEVICYECCCCCR